MGQLGCRAGQSLTRPWDVKQGKNAAAELRSDPGKKASASSSGVGPSGCAGAAIPGRLRASEERSAVKVRTCAFFDSPSRSKAPFCLDSHACTSFASILGLLADTGAAQVGRRRPVGLLQQQCGGPYPRSSSLASAAKLSCCARKLEVSRDVMTNVPQGLCGGSSGSRRGCGTCSARLGRRNTGHLAAASVRPTAPHSRHTR